MSDLPPHLANLTPDEIIQKAKLVRLARERLRIERQAAEDKKAAEDKAEVELAQSQLFEQYRDDPVAFADEVLGIRTWSRQKEMLRAVAAGRRVSVVAAQKVSKSVTLAILALWWVKTRKRGRVIATAVRDQSIREIFWMELRRFYYASRKKLGGEIFLTAQHGLRYSDGRQILGFTADKAEGFGGWSGPEVLFLVDESSGVPETVKEAIDGGMAADGCKFVAMGNGLRTSGWFFESQTSKAAAWHTLRISSTETPNITGSEEAIPGLADKLWLKEMQDEYGPEPEKDPVYQVRVLGLFPSDDASAIVPLSLVLDATARHEATPAEGRLVIGLDVGYEGDDETVMQPRRGFKTLTSHSTRGKDGPQVGAWVRALLFGDEKQGIKGICAMAPDGRPLEKPVVNIDKIGYGASAYDNLKNDPRLEVYGVNVSERPTAKPPAGWPAFNKLRDQLWWGAREHLQRGGTLPPSSGKLRSDLLAVRLLQPTAAGNMQVEGKAEMKKRLGRSPDHGDAYCLAVYTAPPKPRVEVQTRPGY